MKKLIPFLAFFGLFGNILSQPLPGDSLMSLRAPDSFHAEFITTKGDFIIEAKRNWSPKGVDRLFQLISAGFYNDNYIFRVQPDYVVQFGICNNPQLNEYWDTIPVPDEPVKTSNLKGMISFARDGVNSRTVQLFINMKDNPKLDTVDYQGLRGFPPIAKVISGFDTIQKFYSAYGFDPANDQDSVMIYGNAYLKKKYPGLDYIISAKIIHLKNTH